MASTQALLNAITSMQANAQEALPVIPNNGNPGGAHNMPQQNGAAPAAPSGPDLSWLQPSQAMAAFTGALASRQQVLDQQLSTTRQQPPLPSVATVAPPAPAATASQVVLPVIGSMAWNGM